MPGVCRAFGSPMLDGQVPKLPWLRLCPHTHKWAQGPSCLRSEGLSRATKYNFTGSHGCWAAAEEESESVASSGVERRQALS